MTEEMEIYQSRKNVGVTILLLLLR